MSDPAIFKEENKATATDEKSAEKRIKELIEIFKNTNLNKIDLITEVIRELMLALLSLKSKKHTINILVSDAKEISRKFLTILLQYKDTYTDEDQYISIIWEILSCLINSDVNKSASLLLDYINAKNSVGVDFNILITDTLYQAIHTHDKYIHTVVSVLTYTIQYTRGNVNRQLILGRVTDFIKNAVLLLDIIYDYEVLINTLTMFGHLLGQFIPSV